jgi:mRNA-degrading endonuclease RelE of RelBE toxin-antitoxin system
MDCPRQQRDAACRIARQAMRIGDFRLIFEETETSIIVTKFAPRSAHL